MKLLNHFGTACAAAIVVYSVQAKAQQPAPQSSNMTFFVTSVGPGKGADLGGLEGADRHCQTLALPWQNFKGEVIAQNVDELHGDNNKLGMQASLTERGTMIPGVGYSPNRHDVLTGSQMDGHALPAGEDRTCRNWTSSTQGAAMVGHSDRKGLRDDAASRSWNSSHPSRGADGGCSQADLRSTGGDGGPLNENHRSRAF